MYGPTDDRKFEMGTDSDDSFQSAPSATDDDTKSGKIIFPETASTKPDTVMTAINSTPTMNNKTCVATNTPKNGVYYTDSEWDSKPWTTVTSKSRKCKTKNQSTDVNTTSQMLDNSSINRSMKDTDDDSSSTFDEIINQLNNHAKHNPSPTKIQLNTHPQITPTTKTKTSHTIHAKTKISPNIPVTTDPTTLEDNAMDITLESPQPPPQSVRLN